MHKYKQQLIFYKLLIENSRQWSGTAKVDHAQLIFLEPEEDKIFKLDYDITDNDVSYMKSLIRAIWSKMSTLDLPDISGYKSTYSGIKQFEQDLIDGKV